MFQIEEPLHLYSDPWNLPLSERLKMLGSAAAVRPRVAYFYEEPNNSTFRYRAYNMVQVLRDSSSPSHGAAYFFLKDLSRMDEIADLADVLVVCRSRYELHMNQLITKFKARGKRVYFDVDDLVFDPSRVHLIMNTLGQDTEQTELWDYWFAYTSRMEQALRMCDGAITTNDFLAERIKEKTDLPASVVPNFLNQEQMQISRRIFDKKISQNFVSHGPMTLGYFSGSPSHQLDFAIVESALACLMERYRELQLVVVGYIETGERLAPFAKRVRYQPFQDYVNLQRLVGAVDFNLMPLQTNEFTHCKSELKYFEAAAVGTQSIASPGFTYERAIEHGMNGRLAKAHEWIEVIEEGIQNPSKYSFMAQRAWDDIQSKYTWRTQKHAILNALGFDLSF